MPRVKIKTVVRTGVRLVLGALALSACASAQDASQAQQDLFSGTWENDRGSHVLFDNQDGFLSGHYQTNVGQPDKSQKFALTGFVEGDQITFTVNFKGYGSMTSWTGQLTEDRDGSYIRTLWNLTRNVEDAAEDADLWKSITSGASEFRRVDQ